MRTEEWVHDLYGMTNTLVVHVVEDEMVHVADEVMPELDLVPEEWTEVVVPDQEKFARAVPYTTVSTQLVRTGWTRDNPS